MKNVIVIVLISLAAILTGRFTQQIVTSATAINKPVIHNDHYERDLAAFAESHKTR